MMGVMNGDGFNENKGQDWAVKVRTVSFHNVQYSVLRGSIKNPNTFICMQYFVVFICIHICTTRPVKKNRIV